MAKLNSLFQDLSRFPKGPKVSLLMEWDNVDHTFEEVRVWLSKVQTELKKQGSRVPIVDSILDDHRVFGRELNMGKTSALEASHMCFFFSENSVRSTRLNVSCKDAIFVSDEFFILPLLWTQLESHELVLFMGQSFIRAFEVSTFNGVGEISSSYSFKRVLDEYGPNDLEDHDSSSPEVQKRYDADLLKRYAIKVAAEVSRDFNSFSSIRLFSPHKMGHHFVEEVARINKGIPVKFSSYVASSINLDKVKELIKKTDEEADQIFHEPKGAPLTHLKELIWQQELGNLKTLYINESWLREALGRGTEPQSLKSLNQLALHSLRNGAEVHLSKSIEGLIAGELRGGKVRVPSGYVSSYLEQLQELKF